MVNIVRNRYSFLNCTTSLNRGPCRPIATKARRAPSIGSAVSALAVAGLFIATPLLAQTPEKTVPVFTDGQAQIVPGFSNAGDWIKESLWVEAEFDSDGDGKKDRIHIDVYRPRQTETEGLKVPVVYESSPYFAGMAASTSYYWGVQQELGAKPKDRSAAPSIPFAANRTMISGSLVKQWVPRGFAVVHSEAPGTGLSEGCPAMGDDHEALAPKAVIDWLNGRAKGYKTIDGTETVEATWSTGKVGMTGTSYNGTIPVAAASTGVKGLEAIIPIAPLTSFYRYYRSNGLVRSPGGYLGEDIDVLYDFIYSGDTKKRAHCNATVRDGVIAANIDRVHGDLNDFWAKRDYLPGIIKNGHAATLMAHGFNDWNVMPEHSVLVYEALKKKNVPVQAYYHQGAHGGDPPFEMMNRWFTRYLYDVKNDVEKGPHAWIVRESEGGKPGVLTSYDDYPNPKASPVTLFLQSGGKTRGGLLLAKKPKQGKETLIDDVSQSGGALVQAEESPNRLVYVSPELKEAVHISGWSKIATQVAANKPAANFSVWLVVLTPNKPGIITRGWADPQNAESLRKTKELVAGKFYNLAFDLQPDDQIIPAGSRIALMIFSSDKEFTLWPAAGTEVTVNLDATSLVLPVVGGAEALKRAFGSDGK